MTATNSDLAPSLTARFVNVPLPDRACAASIRAEAIKVARLAEPGCTTMTMAAAKQSLAILRVLIEKLEDRL